MYLGNGPQTAPNFSRADIEDFHGPVRLQTFKVSFAEAKHAVSQQKIVFRKHVVGSSDGFRITKLRNTRQVVNIHATTAMRTSHPAVS